MHYVMTTVVRNIEITSTELKIKNFFYNFKSDQLFPLECFLHQQRMQVYIYSNTSPTLTPLLWFDVGGNIQS